MRTLRALALLSTLLTTSAMADGLSLLGNGSGGGGGVTSFNTRTGAVTLSSADVTTACTTCALTTNPLSQFAATTSAQLFGVLSNPTGSGGAAVFATGPTISALTVTGSLTATGLVTNADLVNSSMTLAGHVVALGGTQTIACADLSNGATGCSTATGTSGATIPLLNGANTWSGVQTVTQNDLALLGSSTGKTTLNSGLSGAGNNTLTLPTTSSDTLAALATAETWTAVQTVTNDDLRLLGSSTGYQQFHSANAGSSNFTLTIPAATDTMALLGTAQTFTAVQTVTNDDFRLLGSSTGYQQFHSANAGASNFTTTFPAATDTVAELGQSQTFSVLQTMSAGATISGANTSINASSNFNTLVNTGTSTGVIQIGNSGNTGKTQLLGLSTGTAADVLCLTAGNVVLLQAAASCTISSKRYKTIFGAFKGDALYALLHLQVWDFKINGKNKDPNGEQPTVGLTAEGVDQWASACSIYEAKNGRFITKNGRKKPKAYKQECVIGMLVKALQQQQVEIVDLRKRLR